jgi:hypothetical protein
MSSILGEIVTNSNSLVRAFFALLHSMKDEEKPNDPLQ